MMLIDHDTMWTMLTTHLKNGISIRSLGDAIQLCAAELILRTTVARQFTNGQQSGRTQSTAGTEPGERRAAQVNATASGRFTNNGGA